MRDRLFFIQLPNIVAKVTTNLGFWTYFCTTIRPAARLCTGFTIERGRMLAADYYYVNKRARPGFIIKGLV